MIICAFFRELEAYLGMTNVSGVVEDGTIVRETSFLAGNNYSVSVIEKRGRTYFFLS